jgi:hypothetical protein
MPPSFLFRELRVIVFSRSSQLLTIGSNQMFGNATGASDPEDSVLAAVSITQI